jgi:transposase-like protein
MNLTPSARQRRYHPAEFKAQLIALCQQPGASVAGVALEHRVNANLLRRWIRQDSGTVTHPMPQGMVPIRLEASTPVRPDDPLMLDIQKGAYRVHIRCPASSVDTCARLLGKWLK